MVVVFDVVIDANFGFFPQGKFVGGGGQRFQGRFVYQLE